MVLISATVYSNADDRSKRPENAQTNFNRWVLWKYELIIDIKISLTCTMPKTVGKYELYRTLGEGSYGKVKYGVNKDTKEPCAIKVCDMCLQTTYTSQSVD